MIFAIDFDGTVVTHEYPKIGKDVGAVPVLKELIKNGHKLILYTMRSDELLDDAVDWFEKNDIELYGVNENPSQKEWTNSPKVYAHIYIDDAALGCPIIKTEKRAYVDWPTIEKWFKAAKIIK